MTTAMPAVKPVVTGCGMYWMSLPSLNAPISDQDDAGHQAGDEQPAEAERVHDGHEDDDERRRRAGHLAARAAEERADDAGDDRGVEAVLRRHARGDRQRHRQRQRDHADDEAGHQVGAEIAAAVSLFELLLEAVAEAWKGRRRDVEVTRHGGIIAPPCRRCVRYGLQDAGSPSVSDGFHESVK